MPWTVDKPPRPARNWTREERERCVEAANATLEDGGTDEEAIYACIGAAGKAEEVDMAKRKQSGDGRPMETKQYPVFYTKVVDEDQGIVEEIVAVFGNIDHGKDRIWPGAFKKTIQEGANKLLVLDSHRTDSVSAAIGKPLALREVGADELPADVRARFPDATGGLLATTQYLLDTPEGTGAFKRIKAGVVTQRSIGYDPLDTDLETLKVRKTDTGYQIDTAGEETPIRNLRTIRLREYSPVLFGMNEATTTVSAKAAEGEDGAEPDEEKHGAGGGAAGYRGGRGGWRRDLAGVFSGEGKPQLHGFIRRMHMHAARMGFTLPMLGKSMSEEADEPEPVKALPESNWEDGKPTAMTEQDVREAFWLAWAMLKVKFEIEDEEIPGTIPDWAMSAARAANSKAANLGEMIAAALGQTLEIMTLDLETKGTLSPTERQQIAGAFAATIGMFLQGALPELKATLDRPFEGEPVVIVKADGELLVGHEQPDEVKVGRVLSRANATRLARAMSELNDVLRDAHLLDGDADDEDEEDEKAGAGKAAATPELEQPEAGQATPPTPSVTVEEIAAKRKKLEELKLGVN